jgi:hypothetical protein
VQHHFAVHGVAPRELPQGRVPLFLFNQQDAREPSGIRFGFKN